MRIIRNRPVIYLGDHLLEVQFVAELRDEPDFENIDDLVAQMKNDEVQARACLAHRTMPEEQKNGL